MVSEEKRELIHMLLWYPEMDTDKKFFWVRAIVSDSFPPEVIEQAKERLTRYYVEKSIVLLQSVIKGKE